MGDPFYSATGVPTNSVRLLADRRQALAVPRGDIRLACCAACGFVANVAFDPARVDYSPGYESTQRHSPTFDAFHRDLARSLATRHDLGGRTVLEIGCGRGEFLALLCAEAGCRGVGCDPAWNPAEPAPEGAVRILPTFYEAMPGEPADLVCCKMTLEHVPRPAALVRLVATRQGAGTRLFVQVPNARPIFERAAFWDVYYEHCNYFDAASLAGLLARAGFGVEELAETYAGQYLTAHAVALPAPPPVPSPRPAATGSFAVGAAAAIAAWRAWLAALERGGRRVVLWGGGSKAVAFLAALAPCPAVAAAVDINPRKDGTFLAGTGHPVVAPERLPSLRPDAVVVMNPIYLAEVRARLDALGLSLPLHSVEAGPGCPTA